MTEDRAQPHLQTGTTSHATGGRVPVWLIMMGLLGQTRNWAFDGVVFLMDSHLRDGRADPGHGFPFRLEFAANDPDIVRSFDTDRDPIARNPADHNRDVATDHQPFTNFATENQHGSSSLSGFRFIAKRSLDFETPVFRALNPLPPPGCLSL